MTSAASPSTVVRVRALASRLGITPAVLLAAACWCTLLIASIVIEQASGRTIPTCLFKQATGIPCPTCGSTRAVAQLLSAHITTALQFNPLVVVLLLAAPLWLVYRWVAPRPFPSSQWSPSQRACLGLVALALLASNWIYVILRGN